jgi:ArsR family metal-binding transcriptional regulator
MFLKDYRLEYCRPPNPGATHLRCFAYFKEDITEILPHLNTVLRGHEFSRQPPMLTIKYQAGQARLITIYPQMIAINIVADQREAEDILAWLRQVINDTWERQETITPSFEVPKKPRILEILKCLPRTNCRACGEPTCLVFATKVSNGEAGPEACPGLEAGALRGLRDYLGQFCSEKDRCAENNKGRAATSPAVS